MTTIAVTGAAGSVGRLVVRSLAIDSAVDRVRAFDRAPLPDVTGVDVERLDVRGEDFPDRLGGVDSIVHLAEDPARRADPALAVEVLEKVLAAAERAGCRHVVVVSSAMVYGAHPDNPVPLTEHHGLQPVGAVRYVRAKVSMETAARSWAHRSGARLAVLRPTTTLSGRGSSYVSQTMRSAMALRPPLVEPPIQFLHHDDLASALTRVAVDRRAGTFNVAPDGWIDPEVFGDLLADEMGWPEPVDDLRVRLARTVRRRPVDRALTAYVTHPWVVANDQLRRTGWRPRYSNEEAYVLGTPQPTWRRFVGRRRQELALGAMGIGGAAAVGAVAGVGLGLRRLLR